ncbi:MAG: hypothetical protein FJ044_00530 [Candidatus Cloacimonetes bacterium]|nr:hypothetical protein [Candidatus Cloacimonadota bacterium]
MRKLLNLFNRNLTKIIWVLAILAWVGVGVYYLSTYAHPSFLQEISLFQKTPPPTSMKDWNVPPEGHREPLPGSHYFPSDEEIVEGIVTHSETEYMTLDVNGQLLNFYSQIGSFLAAPDEDEEEIGPLVGKKMRVYYKERDGKFYLVFGEFSK